MAGDQSVGQAWQVPLSPPMPSSVKVGPIRYRIMTDAAEIKRISDEADIGSESEWVAFSDHDNAIIGINPNHDDDVNRVSVVHELLHCTLRLSGVWPNAYARIVDSARGEHGGYSVEEATISGMAGPLQGVLRDNPDLVAWLLSDSTSLVEICSWASEVPIRTERHEA